MVIERESTVTGSIGKPDNIRLRPLLDTLKGRQIGYGVVSQIQNTVETGINGSQELIAEEVAYALISSASRRIHRKNASSHKEGFSPRRSWKDTIKKLDDPNTDPIEARELIREIPGDVYRTFAKDSKHPVFIDLYRVASRANLHPRTKDGDIGVVYRYLDRHSMPVHFFEREVISAEGKISTKVTHFTLVNYVDDEVALLNQANGSEFTAMRISPVKVIGSEMDPEDKPKTTDLRGSRKGNFPRMSEVLAEFGLSPRGLQRLGMNLTDLAGENPPIPIIYNDGRYFIRTADLSSVRDYLKIRLEEFGIGDRSKKSVDKTAG